jgi:hypothetical protein
MNVVSSDCFTWSGVVGIAHLTDLPCGVTMTQNLYVRSERTDRLVGFRYVGQIIDTQNAEYELAGWRYVHEFEKYSLIIVND